MLRVVSLLGVVRWQSTSKLSMLLVEISFAFQLVLQKTKRGGIYTREVIETGLQ